MMDQESIRLTELLASQIGQMHGLCNNMENALKALCDHLSSDMLEGGDGASNHLTVPWIGQNVRDVNTDDWSNSDCGPACVAMWLNYLSKAVTVDDVSKATGLSRGYTYTLPAHLITAADKFGLKLQRVFNISPDGVKTQIGKTNPLIVLVHYASLPKRFDQNFKAGHWIVVTGYTDQGVVYNDPLWQGKKGEALAMTWAEFDKAMSDCAIDGNTARQGLIKA